MKWNIVIGSLVLGLGLSTQSFGFDLLDRMLGMDYDGCGSKAASCGTKLMDPGCGCELGCDSKGGGCKSCTPLLDKIRCHLAAKPCQKGCSEKMVDPGCGSKCGGCESCTPLLDRLRCRLASLNSCKSWKGEKVVDPGCGCEPAYESKCVQKSHASLLDRIFAHRARQKGNSCAKVVDPGCGMDYLPPEAPQEADAPEAAPTPPAPVVDPSAFLPTKRRFIQTTLVR